MAVADRAQARDLIDWDALAADLRRAGPFAVVRHAEARAHDKPRVGRARRPEQSIVDLAQQPSLGFADSSLIRIDQRYGRAQLRGYWLGLMGPMGPLPTHMTEAAFYERQFADKYPLGDWLDLISSRMLQLFYRAWADSQPAAHADRPDDDLFASWLGALSGAMEGAGRQDGFFAHARVHYASVFAGSRSAIALQDALSHLLGQSARVIEYIPRWRDFEPEDRTRLGSSFATLGSDAVLGARVYSAADAFRVVVRAGSLEEYRSLMPGGERFAVAAEAIETFKPTHLEWDLTVEIADDEAPRARLDGRSQLGWTGWMKSGASVTISAPRKRKKAPASDQRSDRAIRADAHLRKTSLRKRKPAA